MTETPRIVHVPDGIEDPLKLLEFFRNNSPPDFVAQARAFNAIPVADQIELLFWMTSHMNATLCNLLAQIESDDQDTTSH